MTLAETLLNQPGKKRCSHRQGNMSRGDSRPLFLMTYMTLSNDDDQSKQPTTEFGLVGQSRSASDLIFQSRFELASDDAHLDIDRTHDLPDCFQLR
jgi:hypothetical protein